MKKEWRYSKSDETKPLVERLLAARGVKTKAAVKEFLNPLETKLTSPAAFTDMPKCTERVAKAIESKEKIVIYGDFDADGVTSTALLYRTLDTLGANVSWFIPEREKEGHGLNTKALVKLMTSEKPKIIITVDCGISDFEAVNFLKSFKIDVIITDHHEAPDVLPQAFGLLNPKAPDALDDKLKAKEIINLAALAGVGVAFKFAQGLLEKFDRLDFVPEILPFVAVGTIADIVPLTGENRYFVTKGLELINKHFGLKSLLESAGYKENITAENVAFGIAPRINASGRLETVDAAMKILISGKKQEIEPAVQTLNEFNKIRQTLCREIFQQAEAMLSKESGKNPAIILFNPEWHLGIIGITASKLTEKYCKPVFLMAYSEQTGQIRCSARSVAGVNLHDVISANSERLDNFGGHAMAAGLAFSTDKISFEDVKKALNNTIKETEIVPFINIDLDLQAAEVNTGLVEEISRLEPFGAGNPSPVFSLKNLTIKEKRLMGENKDHLRLVCTAGERELTCIRWGQGDVTLAAGDALDIAFHPQINEFNGNTSVRLIIDDIHSDALAEEEAQPIAQVKYYDHRHKTDILPQVEDYVKNSKLDICVFAESKTITDALAPFKTLAARILTRDNIRDCDALMFFDYPADRETFEQIIERANPGAIHFMKYEPKVFDEQEFLKTASGMLKFAHNNNSGQVELRRCASFLGKSYNVFEVLFSIFEEIGLIEIFEKTPHTYKINFKGGVDVSLALHSEKYAVLRDLIDECEAFQKILIEEDLVQII